MKKLFASTVAGVALLATQAPGLEMDPMVPGFGGVSADKAVKIIADPDAVTTGLANSFLVMCPGYLMRDLHDNKPNRAVITLYFNTRTALETSLTDLQNNIDTNKAHNYPDTPYPLSSNGLIAADGKMTGAGNLQDMYDKRAALLALPDPLPAVEIGNPAVIRQARSYAHNFCFAQG